jgi:signal transduction histidine kinase
MDYFGSATDIEDLERTVDSLHGAVRRDALVRLAWYLRQRNTAHASQLIEEAQALLADADDALADRCRARILLIRAEISDLHGDVPAAKDLCNQALAAFRAVDHPIGEGDAHLTAHRFLMDAGSFQLRRDAVQSAIECFRRTPDAVRLCYAQLHYAESLLDRQEGDISPDMPLAKEAVALDHPGVGVALNFLCAIYYDTRGETVHALEHYRLGYEDALVAGRYRPAIMAGSNVCEIYYELGSADEAMKWGEKTLELARRCGWPVPLATQLAQLGWLLRRMGRPQDARRLLAEAAELLAPVPRARAMAQVQCELGILEDDLERALVHLDLAAELSVNYEHVHQQLLVRRARADTLSKLGRVDEAIALIDALLEDKQYPNERVEAMRVRATISTRHGLPAPEGSPAASGAIHWLGAALDEARANGMALPADVLSDLSLAHEAAGQPSLALQFERQAAAAREKTRAEAAAHLATALQVRHETERARTEATRQKILAEAEAQRAQALSRASRAKSEYLASMSHELRSPLNSILGFTNLLLKDAALSEHFKELEIIRHSGDEIYALINDVLEKSKAEQQQRTRGPVPPDESLEDRAGGERS